MNPYGYVGGNPVTSVDPFGLSTYVVHRKIGSDDATKFNLLTHSFVAVTDDCENLLHTYGYGNEVSFPFIIGATLWFKDDKKRDWPAAKEAIRNGMAELISDGFLDPFVEKAFQQIVSDDGWLGLYCTIGGNCKNAAATLIEKALDLSTSSTK